MCYDDIDNRTPEQIAKERKAFVEHLDYCSKVVKTWPKWKQGLLGGASKKEIEEEKSMKISPLCVKLNESIRSICDPTPISRPNLGHGWSASFYNDSAEYLVYINPSTNTKTYFERVDDEWLQLYSYIKDQEKIKNLNSLDWYELNSDNLPNF